MSPMARPPIDIDWQAVAMFLAGVMVEEHPDYAPLVIQVIGENTTPIGL